MRLDALVRFPTAFITTAEEFRARQVSDHEETLAHGKTWGVFDRDSLVGIAAFLPEPFAAAAHRASIGGFYVMPEHQGAGMADALMEAMVAHAETRGIWQLELFVADDNPRALRFYERHGFVQRGVLPNAALVDGVITSDLFLTRDLRR